MFQSTELEGKKIAILMTDGFEQSEYLRPKDALESAGAETFVIAPRLGDVRGWNRREWSHSVEVDLSLNEATAEEFDALFLPGGALNSDKLRMNQPAVYFVRGFFEQSKPVAAICHAPWVLIETGLLKDRRVTSYPSLKTDLENAGAHWSNEEVVVDDGLVTSRKPEDIPAFNEKMIEVFAKGQHPRAHLHGTEPTRKGTKAS